MQVIQNMHHQKEFQLPDRFLLVGLEYLFWPKLLHKKSKLILIEKINKYARPTLKFMHLMVKFENGQLSIKK